MDASRKKTVKGKTSPHNKVRKKTDNKKHREKFNQLLSDAVRGVKASDKT